MAEQPTGQKKVNAEIHCEGCASGRFAGQLTRTGRVSFKGIPNEWTQTGRSRKHPGSIATWCPTCSSRKAWRDWLNPSPAEIRVILRSRAVTP